MFSRGVCSNGCDLSYADEQNVCICDTMSSANDIFAGELYEESVQKTMFMMIRKTTMKTMYLIQVCRMPFDQFSDREIPFLSILYLDTIALKQIWMIAQSITTIACWMIVTLQNATFF